MCTFAEFTATPSTPRLNEILSKLHALPSVSIVFSHPVWELYKVGAERHLLCVNEFLRRSGHFSHVLELNGLRGWQEDRQALAIAQKWTQLVTSGSLSVGVAFGTKVSVDVAMYSRS
jgi:hypothetical protein